MKPQLLQKAKSFSRKYDLLPGIFLPRTINKSLTEWICFSILCVVAWVIMYGVGWDNHKYYIPGTSTFRLYPHGLYYLDQDLG
jgi:hypothetical protein